LGSREEDVAQGPGYWVFGKKGPEEKWLLRPREKGGQALRPNPRGSSTFFNEGPPRKKKPLSCAMQPVRKRIQVSKPMGGGKKPSFFAAGR